MRQEDLDMLRAMPVAAPAMMINGKSVMAETGETLDVVSPIDGALLTQIPNASEADVTIAVTSARRSFDSGVWSRTHPMVRKKVMLAWADLIEKHAIDLAVLGVRDNGTEISMAFKAEPMSAANTIRYYAEAIDKIYGEVAPTDPSTLAMILKEPIGVVGAIVPWNFPLMISAWKVAPAIAMGNSLVLKPSEVASLSVLRMVALAHEAGLPEGVLNVLTGAGPVSGHALAMSMDVDALAFTGSGPVGRQLMEAAAKSNLKRIFLELGGKSPHIVFDDTADLDTAAEAVVTGIFRNSGQVCVAGSRLLVHDTIHDAFVEKIVRLTEKLRVGDPLDLSTQIGALSSEGHMHRIQEALEGANSVVSGGIQILSETGGFYMAPTIVTDIDVDDRLFSEEVFGPVLTVSKFTDEIDAISQANASELGLASGVWTSNLGRAHRMVASLHTGVVHVNTYGGSDNTVPLSLIHI